jgi:lysophospholipase L1-like esterase
LVRQALAASGLSSVSVVNRGMNGAKLNDLVYGSEDWRMPAFVHSFAADHPTIAVIFVGTNDCPYVPHVPYFRVSFSCFWYHSYPRWSS